MKLLSCVWLFVTPWTVAYQAPSSMEFFRQKYWSGLPFLLQGIFPIQGSNPGLLHCRQLQCLNCLNEQGSLLCDMDRKLTIWCGAYNTDDTVMNNFSGPYLSLADFLPGFTIFVSGLSCFVFNSCRIIFYIYNCLELVFLGFAVECKLFLSQEVPSKLLLAWKLKLVCISE